MDMFPNLGIHLMTAGAHVHRLESNREELGRELINRLVDGLPESALEP